MNVVVISPGLPSVVGGVERSVGRLLGYLDRWGVDWTLVTAFDDDGSEQGRCVPVRSGIKGPLGRIALGWSAPRRALRLAPDLIHVHGAELGFGFGAGAWLDRVVRIFGATPRRRPPVIVTAHGTLRAALAAQLSGMSLGGRAVRWGAIAPASFLESTAYRSAAAVACVSDRVASEVAGSYGVPARRLRVIPNAVDTDVFQPPISGMRDARTLVWVGRPIPEKGLDTVLEVFRAVRSTCPDIQLNLVGIEGTRLGRGITAIPALTPAGLATLLGRSRLLLSTSRYEGDALVVKEALACGTPAVVSPAAAAGVDHGVNGIVVGSKLDTAWGRSEFARSLIRLLNDDELWGRLSRSAVASRNEMSPATEMARYRRLYREVLDGR